MTVPTRNVLWRREEVSVSASLATVIVERVFDGLVMLVFVGLIAFTDNEPHWEATGTKAGVFYVTGEVKNPGAYNFEQGSTVLKAVTLAGGFTDRASEGRIKIIRKTGGEEETIKRVRMDDPVYPDDVIVVPESFF